MSEMLREQGHVTVRPGSDVVASMAGEFKSELKALLDEGIKDLVVDLSNVEMVDSVGLGVLIATHNSLRQAGGQLVVSNPSADIQSLFRTMRLDKHFKVVVGQKETCHG
jgi:anti-sigma B factor antagonist